MGSFSLWHWVITIAIFYGVYRLFKSIFPGAQATLYCSTCGHEGPTKLKTKGSLLIEIVLWICFIVPGLVYSLWRISTRHKVCTQCGSSTLLPTQSPMAIAAKQRLNSVPTT